MDKNYNEVKHYISCDNPIITDHKIHGVKTLPGVVLIDIVCRTLRKLYGAQLFEFNNVVFKRPVVAAQENDQYVVVGISKHKAHYDINVTSHDKGNPEANRENMSCQVQLIDEYEPTKVFDVDGFIAHCDNVIDLVDVYGLAHSNGIEHHAFMKTNGKVYLSEQQELMEISLSQSAEAFREKFYIHPAFLDSATFAGTALLLNALSQNTNAERTPYIPFVIEKIRLNGAFPETIYVHTNLAQQSENKSDKSDIHYKDIRIVDALGIEMAKVTRLTTKRIRSPEDILPPRALTSRRAEVEENSSDDTSIEAFIRHHIGALLEADGQALNGATGFYDLGLDSAQLLLVVQLLEQASGQQFYPTLLFEFNTINSLVAHLQTELGNEFKLDSTLVPVDNVSSETHDMARLETLSGRSALVKAFWKKTELTKTADFSADKKRFIVIDEEDLILVPLTAQYFDCDTLFILRSSAREPLRMLQDKYEQLLTISRRLMLDKSSRHFALQVVASTAINDTLLSMLSGLLKTIMQEHAGCMTQLVKFDVEAFESLREKLCDEVTYFASDAQEVLFNTPSATRYVRALTQWPVEHTETPYKAGGVYVVVGGLGGIGQQLTLHLCEQVACTVVVLSRSVAENRSQRVDDQSDVHYMQADVTEQTNLNMCFEHIRATFGAINGVFHCAAVLNDQLIVSRQNEDASLVFAPKLQGTVNLDAATQQDQLDFFVLFSSLAAFSGNMGQSDYAAANAFLGAFSRRRNKQVKHGERCGYTVAIDWPYWSEGGMSIAQDKLENIFETSGMLPLPSSQGWWALQQILADGRHSEIGVFYATEDSLQHMLLPYNDAVDCFETIPLIPQINPVSSQAEQVVCRDVAVVGMAGRFPQSPSIKDFARNLQVGQDCITGTPHERWQNYDFSFAMDDYCDQGGYIEDIAQFDPVFFRLSPKHAISLDPQARLFLETAWQACQDAGLPLTVSQANTHQEKLNVGVFVGVFWSHYELFSAELAERGSQFALGTSASSVANLVSYCLNLKGPSVALDSMCSSSLSSVHFAVESLRRGECEYAIAGGVNLVCHPHKFKFLREAGFLSSDLRCRAFGADGDGYVPGEGVGAVLLMRKQDALQLGYPIQGVIKGSALNHSGRTAGLSVPEPNAQADVIARALQDADVSAQTISYVEAHGTGTSLGDPVEIEGLSKAYRKWTDEKQFCAIGSVKSNVGHLEAAAGIAGLIKVLLQLKSGEIFPSLYTDTLNPLIDFSKSPFYVAQSKQTWKQHHASHDQVPLRAAVSAFGASGSNAHLIVEAHDTQSKSSQEISKYIPAVHLVIMSARDESTLRDYVHATLESLDEHRTVADEELLLRVMYTLQVGRESMACRVAFCVSTLSALRDEMRCFLDKGEHSAVCYFHVNDIAELDGKRQVTLDDFTATIDRLHALAKQWVEGAYVPWERLYIAQDIARVSLPSPQLKRQSYWLPNAMASQQPQQTTKTVLPQLNTAAELAHTRIEQSQVPISDASINERVVLEDIAQQLTCSFAQVMFLDEQEINPNLSFADMNLDSVVGVEWVKEINQIFNTQLKASVLYDHPNIGELSQHLYVKLGAVQHAAPCDLPQEHLTLPPIKVDNVQQIKQMDVSTKEPRAVIELSNIEAKLTASFAEMMMMSTDEINVNMSFLDLGLDSVIGVEWIKTLNEQLGLELRASCIYDHPTVKQLGEYICATTQVANAASVSELGMRHDLPVTKESTSATASSALAKVSLISTDLVVDLDTISASAIGQNIQAVECDQKTLNSVRQGLIESFCATMYMAPEEVLLDVPFSEMGLDSVVGVEWVKQINIQFSAQFKASCLYDFPTINTLCDYITSELGVHTSLQAQSTNSVTPSVTPSISLTPTQYFAPLTVNEPSKHEEASVTPQVVIKEAQTTHDSQLHEKIAVIGMAGRYPGAENLASFWQNLSSGVNSIQQVPSWRWDVERFYDPKPTLGKVYSKWLGALDDVECFDPLFFNITPAEAEEMDPQQRLFLQLSYHAFEDAGYSPQSLSNALCGVYLGIMNCDYTVITSKSGGGLNTTANNNAIAAARIAYFFNLKGPAIPIDTACSSSLVAIHLACQALKNHEIDLALAGGVTLYLVPESYLGMCAAGMLAKDGQCKTFDNAADGFVPGEGAGAVVLKRLAQAQADHDNIQGVILASAINQDGKTNGITSPSVKSQTELTSQLYKRYNIDPSTISYAEMHGTGTRLGDPIELEALCSAFNKYTQKQNYCAIGSVKTNIGHTSGAAGVASVHKVLLSMRHKQLTPSLNFNEPNDHFDFASSPFYVNTQLKAWQIADGEQRRACVSSFGFSGTNAHLVLQEPPQTQPVAPYSSTPLLFVLSARHPEQLKTIASNLSAWLHHRPDIGLADIAHTLQMGRDAMSCRVAIVANSISQLLERLALFLNTIEVVSLQQHDIFVGVCVKNQSVQVVRYDSSDISGVAESWVQGNSVIWPTLHDCGAIQKISLPGYPFLKEKYWLNVDFDSFVDNASKQQVETLSPPKGLSLSKLQWCALSDLKVAPACNKQRHVILIEVGQDPLIKKLATSHDDTVTLHTIGISTAQHPQAWGREYTELVDQLLSYLQHFIAKRSTNTEVLLQVVVPSVASSWCLSGISAAMKSLTQEIPEFSAQTIALSESEDAPFWWQQLQEVARYPDALCVKYAAKQPLVRQMTCLRDAISVANATAPAPWQHHGVYWICGGMGGLGLIFARDIFDKTDGNAVVILSGRSEPSETMQQALSEFAGQIVYRTVDIVEQASVQGCVDWILSTFGKLNGVLHSAGINHDTLLVNKTCQTWQQLLEPKVEGLINLDICTAELDLDLFVAFSSIAAVSGNAGQIDYAAANAFMDSYIAIRQQQVLSGERSGLSTSINWPYWRQGGMTLNDEYLKNAGMSALSNSQGLALFYDIVSRNLEQGIVINLLSNDVYEDTNTDHVPTLTDNTSPHLTISAHHLKYQLEQMLKQQLMQVTKLKSEQIDTRESFESYGIDSIMITKLNNLLEQQFTQLPKTLFFELDSISKLTEYFAEHHYDACLDWIGIESATVSHDTGSDILANHSSCQVVPQDAEECVPVAIIGMHGKYPQAENIHEFWRNLRSAKDCVTEISSSRWDIEAFYTPNQRDAAFEGKSYSKWGGFLEGFDRFDAQFFKISPKEALNMDPQERLFLSSSWGVLEDAGYSSKLLQDHYAGNVGVFAGITKTGFDLYGPVLWANGGQAFPHTSFSSVANRVSYWFNFNGPSIAVDTMCSSSLTAIHLACESLRRRECQFALAGGVNIYAHPSSYVALSGQQMLSSDGKCKSFAAGGNGFVPGEGVGIVLLKLLSNAIADGDNVYASIRGTTVNHGGHTNGYTVPNPVAQGQLIAKAIANSGVKPEHISYIEAHGTGTELGDPIEISGLCKAFSNAKVDCRIGSIKSNIGHLEAAAGVAGLMKVVLQMQHKTWVPTLHVQQPNPAIDFDSTPFALQTELAPWGIEQHAEGCGEVVTKRLAGLSSFGAGGSNAHAIIEEFNPIAEPATDSVSGPYLVVLSGRDEQTLKWRAQDLLNYLESDACTFNDSDLYAIASTLQLGRDEMEQRWATAVSDLSQLKYNLAALLADKSDITECYRGQVGTELTQQLNDDEDTEHMVKSWLRKGKYWRVLKLWVCGVSIDWTLLYTNRRPKRVSLPTYRFKEKSIWFEKAQLRHIALKGASHTKNQGAYGVLHPLVHENISDFFAQQFRSRFSGEELCLTDHVIAGQSILPAVAYLEMALFSAMKASNREQSELAGMCFNNVVWVSPILFDKAPLDVSTALIPQGDNKVYFEISSQAHNHPHCRGKISWHDAKSELIDIKEKEQQSHMQLSQQQCYAMFTAMGVHYGPAHQAIHTLRVGTDYVLAHAKLPPVVATEAQQYTLHPSILDAAFQAILGFSVDHGALENAQTQVQGSAIVPFSLDALTVHAQCAEEVWILIQRQPSSAQSQLEKFNISITNVKGEVLVSLTGFNARPISGNGNSQLSSGKTLYFQPSKVRAEIQDESSNRN